MHSSLQVQPLQHFHSFELFCSRFAAVSGISVVLWDQLLKDAVFFPSPFNSVLILKLSPSTCWRGNKIGEKVNTW